MGKPILNYTTQIEATKTVGEIHTILAHGKAREIKTMYNDSGEPSGIEFMIIFEETQIFFRLPCNAEGVYKSLRNRRGVPARLQTMQQARRVVWRIIKDWIEAQMAIVEARQAELTEVFLPYVVAKNGRTFYQEFAANKHKLLTA